MSKTFHTLQSYAIMRAMLTHTTMLLALCATTLVAEDGAGTAGWPELAAIDRRIDEVQAALSACDAQLAEQDRLLATASTAAMSARLAATVTRAGQPADPRLTSTPYPALLHDRLGFDPLDPLQPWQQEWQALLDRDLAAAEPCERLRVSLHRLQHLRDRLQAALRAGAGDAPNPEQPAAPGFRIQR
jgi:hypothetical protein